MFGEVEGHELRRWLAGAVPIMVVGSVIPAAAQQSPGVYFGFGIARYRYSIEHGDVAHQRPLRVHGLLDPAVLRGDMRKQSTQNNATFELLAW